MPRLNRRQVVIGAGGVALAAAAPPASEGEATGSICRAIGAVLAAASPARAFAQPVPAPVTRQAIGTMQPNDPMLALYRLAVHLVERDWIFELAIAVGREAIHCLPKSLGFCLEDLVLMETGDRTNFQGRYVLHYPWQGEPRCVAGDKYLDSLPARFRHEAENLAGLTGWSQAEIEIRMEAGGQAAGA